MSILFTKDVGETQKFNENGTFRRFPGNTIICDLSQERELLDEISLLQDRYRQSSFSSKFAYLPPQSIHMTAMELLCHYHRWENKWTSFLELSAPIEETDTCFAEKLMPVAMPSQFVMKIDGITASSIRLRPADKETSKLLQDFRDNVSIATGVRFPDHETYQFHISFAYRIIHTTPDEEAQLTKLLDETLDRLKQRLDVVHMGQVIYTVFEDMSKFERYTPNARDLLKLKYMEEK